VSVYPDIRPLEEIKGYLAKAASYGYSRVFSSMFQVPGTPAEVLALFKELIDHAHTYGIEVSLDINPPFMKRIGATPADLSVLASIGVDILRMDGAYGVDENIMMLKNTYDIRIEYNASALLPETIESLVSHGVSKSRILACHNFYPQRYTGFRWDRFLDVNQRLSRLGIPIGAFVASHASESHGVWDPPCGLPTVERLRDFTPELQARILAAAGTTDIFFGNAYATEEELMTVANALEPYTPKYLSEEHRQYVRDSVFLDYERIVSSVTRVQVEVLPEATEIEREILFEFFPHVDMGDSSEWIWRSRMPRVFYKKHDITKRPYGQQMFMPGDVVIVNDGYTHYAGEIQVVLEPMPNDGIRNLIGKITPNEMYVLDAVHDGDTIVFIPAT
jgi:hypothetical protein